MAILRSALAGLAATVPMTAVMLSVTSALPREQQYPLPPRRITAKLLARTGLRSEVSSTGEVALTWASHFVFGTAMGAVYGMLPEKPSAPPAVRGAAFGFAVWAGSYVGWLPAAGILSPPTRHPAPRVAMMIAAHLVWGATLGVLAERANRRAPEPVED